jgi:hypothetical protein
MLHRVPIISFNQSALLFLFQGCRDRVPTPPNKQKKSHPRKVATKSRLKI